MQPWVCSLRQVARRSQASQERTTDKNHTEGMANMRTDPLARGPLAIALALLALVSAGTALADEQAVLPENTQLPQQVLPTGAEDAPAAQDARLAVPLSALGDAAVSEAELTSRLIEMTSESDDGLVIVTLPDGSKSVDLRGRFMSVAMAGKDADGNPTVVCYTGHDAVEHAKEAESIAAEMAKAVKAAKPVQLEEK
jgi:hypothetical protein